MTAKQANCPAEYTLARIGGRWKIPLIFHSMSGVRRFSELARSLTGVSQRMLTRQLREMERHGLAERKIYEQVPPRVECALTPLGRSLKPGVGAMCRRGELHAPSAACRGAQS